MRWRRRTQADRRGPDRSSFSSRHIEGTGGGEAKLIVKDSIVLDATVNPDFSDVESEQPQFTVNQRYPVYFPELRPFFLEMQATSERRSRWSIRANIVHPEYGMRMTARWDIRTWASSPSTTGSRGRRCTGRSGLQPPRQSCGGRVAEDLGKGSSAGAIYTDEEFGGGWNRIGGIDGTLRFNEHWTATGQMVESSTKGTVDSGTPPSYSPARQATFNCRAAATPSVSIAAIRTTAPALRPNWALCRHRTSATALRTPAISGFPSTAGSELWHGDVAECRIRPSERPRLPLFELRSVLGAAEKYRPCADFRENSDTVSPLSYSALNGFRNFTENYVGFVVRGAPWSQFNFTCKPFAAAM